MANLEVLALDTAVPQIRAPGAGDGYSVPRDMTLASGTTLTAPTVNATTLDATNVEVTNIKAKDGTAAATIADSTGVVSIAANPILSGGTANGVLYLNASKVATSGSALTFDGTNLGIGTSSPLGTLGIAGSATATIVIPRSSNGSTASPVETQLIGSTFTNGNFAAGVYALNSFVTNSANWLAFKTTDGGNTTATRMTLNQDGNLGLGVTPSAWGASSQALQNGGGSFFQYNNDRVFIGQNTYIDTSFADRFIGNGYATRYRQYQGTHAFYVSTVSNSSGAGASQSLTQAMTLDADANWNIDGGTGKGRVTISNASANNNILSTTTGFSAYNPLRLIASELRFETGSSPSERARIDASGNLALGTTSAASLFHMAKGGGYAWQYMDSYGTGYYGVLDSRCSRNSTVGSFTATNNGDTLLLIRANGTNSGATAFAQGASIEILQSDAAGATYVPAAIKFNTSDGTNAVAERARITSGGSFCVGATDSLYKFLVNVQSGANRDIFAAQIEGASNGLTVKWNDATTTTRVNIANLPTSSAGLAAGDLWNDGGTLKVA